MTNDQFLLFPMLSYGYKNTVGAVAHLFFSDPPFAPHAIPVCYFDSKYISEILVLLHSLMIIDIFYTLNTIFQNDPVIKKQRSKFFVKQAHVITHQLTS